MIERFPIRALDPALIDQIAAGEVVERPSSVVKELVENALDSGAHQIAVDLTDGGLGAIVITDDGCGMGPQELHAALSRHHTSKLRHFSDLQSLVSYGFRGEALSSIASVSRLTLTSRPAGAGFATRLRIEGGRVLGTESVGAPYGTSLCVEDLFFNVPARRKFLRGAATEQAHVHDSLLRTAIGCRRGGFVLTAGTRTLLDVPHHAAPHERPGLAFGRRQRQLSAFAGPPGAIAVSGFAAPPSKTRRDASSLWAFVNGRPVRDRMLQRATMAGYQAAFPDALACVLVFIDVAPDLVDVNVHPQKLEVRFDDSAAVYRAVADAVALAAAKMAHEVRLGRASTGPLGQATVPGLRPAPAGQPASPWLASSASALPGLPSAGAVASRNSEASGKAANASDESPPKGALAVTPETNSSLAMAGRGADLSPRSATGRKPAPRRPAGPAASAAAQVPACVPIDARLMARPAAARASARAAPQATGATSQGQLPLQLPFCWQQLTPLSATPPGTLCCEEPERALVLISLKAARAVLARAGCCHVPAPRSPSTRLPLAVVWAAGPAVAASLTAPLLARLGGWGLHLEPIGERRFLICGVPAAFAQADAVSVVDALFACGIVGAAFAANDEPQAVPPLSPHAAQAWAGAIGDAGGWPEQRGEPISSWAPTLLAALDQAAVRPERVALTLGADHPALVANVAPPRERQNHPQNLANIP